MNFSNEMIEKAKTASSSEELLEMAKAEGIELSAADAEEYFRFLHSSGPLSDEELEQVAGGKGETKNKKTCKYCGGDQLRFMNLEYAWDSHGEKHYCALYFCDSCNYHTFFDIFTWKRI